MKVRYKVQPGEEILLYGLWYYAGQEVVIEEAEAKGFKNRISKVEFETKTKKLTEKPNKNKRR